MAKRAFEDKLTELDAVSSLPAEEALPALQKALKSPNNYLVAKAAEIVRRLPLKELTPDLVAAFDRFFVDAEKRDPQCWAKNAISRALAEFEYEDSTVFLRGLRHIQMEPVWGGRSDTAGTLRSICAHALVGCRELREPELLGLLIELFRDKDNTVRAEAVRAIAQVGSEAASLLLRLRATVGNDEPEVLANCFAGVLAMEGTAAIAWVCQFLQHEDEIAGEAALALGQTRSSEVLDALRKAFAEHRDPWFGGVLLSAIALTRGEEAFDFLLELVREESRSAADAISAIWNAVPPTEVRERLETAVRETGNERLGHVLRNLQGT
ncbi:MAG TPA: HEAT repeat domain-containing protein [Alloacidobacterium sp.]|nr:HEAT repeat domain-containing protein [Alloacidobacterium sp.]